MTQDPRMTARSAREGLAQGLNLLQTPGLPPAFLDAAEPIARAMGSLMSAERSDGSIPAVKPHADVALAALREALGRLQTIQTGHPAAEQAMAAVAGSLGHVHSLTRLEAAPQPQYQQPAQPQYQQPAQPQYQQPAQPQYQPPQFQPPQQPQFQPPTQPQFQPPQFQPPQQPQFQPPPQPQFQPPPQPQFQPPPQPQFQPPQPAAQRAPQPQFQPPPAAHIQHTAPSGAAGFAPGAAHRPSLEPNPPDSIQPSANTVEAELGAHSPSNFYKTLNGNDVVDHGGIFVATYNVPKLNTRIQIRVHLPGGYFFDCGALVRWTRESRDNPDAPPGFGAQLQGVSQEQRQLIQRYVRNREPLFYDDL